MGRCIFSFTRKGFRLPGARQVWQSAAADPLSVARFKPTLGHLRHPPRTHHKRHTTVCRGLQKYGEAVCVKNGSVPGVSVEFSRGSAVGIGVGIAVGAATDSL